MPTEIPERPYLSLTSLRAALPGLGLPLDGLGLVGGRTQPVRPLLLRGLGVGRGSRRGAP